jgi:hypothetical protein
MEVVNGPVARIHTRVIDLAWVLVWCHVTRGIHYVAMSCLGEMGFTTTLGPLLLTAELDLAIRDTERVRRICRC